MYRKTLITLLLVLAIPCISGCMYRQTTQQGNIVTEEECYKLRLGMTKSQVVALLGKPVLDNIFQQNTWYYIYTQQRGNQKMIKKRLVLYFSQGRVAQIIKDQPLEQTAEQ